MKMRYPDDYNFDKPGQDEAECDEFMNEMKLLFEAIAQLKPDLIIQW